MPNICETPLINVYRIRFSFIRGDSCTIDIRGNGVRSMKPQKKNKPGVYTRPVFTA